MYTGPEIPARIRLFNQSKARRKQPVKHLIRGVNGNRVGKTVKLGYYKPKPRQ